MDNTSKNKRIAKNTLLLAGRMLITMFVGIYSSRILLQNLGVTDYGIYNVVGGVVGMFTVLNVSLIHAAQRFITFELGKKDGDVPKVFGTSMTIFVALSVAFILLAETIGLYLLNEKLVVPPDRMFAAQVIYQISVLTAVFGILNVPYDALIIAHERMGVYAYVNVIRSLLMLAFAYILAISPIDNLIAYSVLMALMSFSFVAFYNWYCRHNFKIPFSVSWHTNTGRQMLSFSGWSFLGTIVGILNSYGMGILLNTFFGPVVNAANALVLQVYGSLYNFSTSFQKASDPQLVKSYAEGNLNYLEKLFVMVCKISLMLILIVVLPFYIRCEYVLNLWLDKVPEYTAELLRINLIYAILIATAAPIETIIFATGKVRRYEIFNFMILIFILPVSYVFLKLGYSPMIAYVVYCVIFFISRIVVLRFVANEFKSSVTKLVVEILMKPLFVSVTCFMLASMLSSYVFDNFVGFIVVGIMGIVVSLPVCLFFLFDKSEKNMVKSFIKDKFHISCNNI